MAIKHSHLIAMWYADFDPEGNLGIPQGKGSVPQSAKSPSNTGLISWRHLGQVHYTPFLTFLLVIVGPLRNWTICDARMENDKMENENTKICNPILDFSVLSSRWCFDSLILLVQNIQTQSLLCELGFRRRKGFWVIFLRVFIDANDTERNERKRFYLNKHWLWWTIV